MIAARRVYERDLALKEARKAYTKIASSKKVGCRKNSLPKCAWVGSDPSKYCPVCKALNERRIATKRFTASIQNLTRYGKQLEPLPWKTLKEIEKEFGIRFVREVDEVDE